MYIFFELGQIFFYAFAMAIFMPIFWIVLLLVYLQYRRIATMEEKLFGRVINPIGRQMLVSLGFGLIGGLIASATLLLLGLSLEQIGLYFIWPVALLLLLINPRFLCFSYAGGIVAVMVLAVRYIFMPLFPAIAENAIVASLLNIHIPALLVLIGLLHLVEALLIFFDGHRSSSPLYLKHSSGKVVGAFTLQRFWPIPLVALMVTITLQSDIVGVSMPGWWPILSSAMQPGLGESLQYMAIPVAAGLGYGDMALSSRPLEKAKITSGHLAIYSAVLLVAAIGAEFYTWLILPGVLFAPLGHELLIWYGKQRENLRWPLYTAPASGVRVMMVLPDTAADEAGLKNEDLISKINGEAVDNNTDLLDKIDDSYFMVLVEVFRAGSPISLVLRKRPQKAASAKPSFQKSLNAHSPYSVLHQSAAIGLIAVPSPDSPVYLEIKKSDLFGSVKRFFNKLRSYL